MLNLSIILEESARKHAAKPAFIFNGKPLPYANLNAAANQVANGLKALGIAKNDKVALSCLNLPYFPIIYFGILKAGAVVVPLNVLLKDKEIAYHLADSDAKAFFCFQGTEELPMGTWGHAAFEETKSCGHYFEITADPAAAPTIAGTKTLGMLMKDQPAVFDTVQTRADDSAVILYTSGTTGKPKGAELSHFNVFYNTKTDAELFHITHEDTQLIVLPLFHSFGQVVQMNTTVFSGGSAVLLPRFEPEPALELMKTQAVTIFAGVPTMYWALLNYPGAKGYVEAIKENLRLAVSGGSSLPVQVLKDFEALFEVPILEGYGLSESSPVASFNHLDRERKPGSIGQPIWGVEMKVIDADGNEVKTGEKGEIVIRGHNVMKGYYKREEVNRAVLKGDWLHTGDVATMDEDGYFYIVDRTKDMIIRGGFNVYPREVEEIMMEHEAVSLVAVIGIPHDSHGEEVKAYVVLKDGAEATEESILAWGKSRMGGHKYPRVVEIRKTLPMTATGKILKKDLRAEAKAAVSN